jgi:N-acetylmuramoyl-L-alanine amidase
LSLSCKRIASRLSVPLRGGAIIAAVAALALLPMEASHAGILDFLRGKKSDTPKSRPAPERAAPAKQAAPLKHVTPKDAAAALQSSVAKLRSVKPEAAEEPVARKCDPSKFRIVVDVGHTAESEGAISARNVPEFDFNLRLARQIVEKLKSDGFAEARLLVTTGKARPSLGKRVGAANHLHADLFLSIHHDSVPDNMMESWEYEGKKSRFSDRFSGYGVFVSKSNPDFASSFHFAKLIGRRMHAEGFKFADQYTLPVMGKYRHDLLDREAGVYRYDHLIVLMKTDMPAALLEAGSISNRDEELQVASPERQTKTVGAVSDALREYCGMAPAKPATPPDAQAKADH